MADTMDTKVDPASASDNDKDNSTKELDDKVQQEASNKKNEVDPSTSKLRKPLKPSTMPELTVRDSLGGQDPNHHQVFRCHSFAR